MTEFKEGQRVKVEYEGVIVAVHHEPELVYIIQRGGRNAWIYPKFSTITPLDPPDWPPQAGDIWEADGGEFLARKSMAGRDAIVCIPVDDIHNHYAMDTEPFKALNPVLVRRRGQS